VHNHVIKPIHNHVVKPIANAGKSIGKVTKKMKFW
jgi:hypothetical protein